MKIDAEVRESKNGKTFYIYIPILKKFVMLEGIESDYLKMLIEKSEAKKQ